MCPRRCSAPGQRQASAPSSLNQEGILETLDSLLPPDITVAPSQRHVPHQQPATRFVQVRTPRSRPRPVLSSPRWARLRAFIRSTSAARCFTPFPLLRDLCFGTLHLLPPPLHRPTSLGCSWCVRPRGVSFYILCILHPASKPIVGCFSLSCLASCIHYFSVSPEAVSLSRLPYTYLTDLVSSDSTCLDSFQPRVFRLLCSTRFVFFFFGKSHIPPSSPFLPRLADNIVQRPQLDFLGGTPMPPS